MENQIQIKDENKKSKKIGFALAFLLLLITFAISTKLDFSKNLYMNPWV